MRLGEYVWGREETRNIYTIDVSFCFFWVQACIRINCQLHTLRSHALYSQFSAFVPTSVPTSRYAGSRSYMTRLLRSSSLASQRSPGIASTISLLDGMQIKIMCMCSLTRERAYLCPTLCDPMDCSLPSSSVHGNSPGKNTGVGSLSLLQGIFPMIFPTQESNWGSYIPSRFFTSWATREALVHCREKY